MREGSARASARRPDFAETFGSLAIRSSVALDLLPVCRFGGQPFESPADDGASAFARVAANTLEPREQLAIEAEGNFGLSRHWYEFVILWLGPSKVGAIGSGPMRWLEAALGPRPLAFWLRASSAMAGAGTRSELLIQQIIALTAH